jgi:hypothetical protein
MNEACSDKYYIAENERILHLSTSRSRNSWMLYRRSLPVLSPSSSPIGSYAEQLMTNSVTNMIKETALIVLTMIGLWFSTIWGYMEVGVCFFKLVNVCVITVLVLSLYTYRSSWRRESENSVSRQCAEQWCMPVVCSYSCSGIPFEWDEWCSIRMILIIRYTVYILFSARTEARFFWCILLFVHIYIRIICFFLFSLAMLLPIRKKPWLLHKPLVFIFSFVHKITAHAIHIIKHCCSL